ncbi:hypothetical protein SAMN04487996_112139 [Dyadobacter soli]|uniref:Uncharacterized protein n=1 Tax=Dyadobacter soli TaxID=659014 RepID=A0A1G7NRU5_9BACT|nr:hypothetical protein [Dyadobacter soli]SDF76706.1 hypothetical protein SAMN04487996_112139 [Dyadobacter soli]
MEGDIQFKIGRRTNDPRSITPEERSKWQKQLAVNARDYLFSIGQPLVYKRDGHIIAEHKDGRLQVIR